MSTASKIKPTKASAEEETEPQPASEAPAATDIPQQLRDFANVNARIDLDGTLSDLLTLPVAARTELPESCRDIAVIRAAVNAGLITDFWATLSPSERAQLQTYSSEGFTPPALRGKWDHYVRNEAVKQWGARLLLSDHVMARVWAWAAGEKNGIWEFNALFNEMHKSASVERKDAKGSITPRDRRAKAPFVAEINELQGRVRAKWPETANEVRELVAREVENSPPFLQLKKNAPQLHYFLGDDKIALAFRGDPDSIVTKS